MSFNDWNQKIIDEFRANEGRVGGQFEGAPMLLLHARGRRSGLERVNPVMYQQVGESFAVFGSKGGMPSHPDWCRNLAANPIVTIEVGTETFEALARVAEGEERERIWEEQKKRYPGFAGYEKATTRQIPVVILERVTDPA